MAGGIRRKETSGVIHTEEDKEPVRYCPICLSILQKWILDFQQNNKAIKVPNKMQCLTCGEIITIYHPSSLI